MLSLHRAPAKFVNRGSSPKVLTQRLATMMATVSGMMRLGFRSDPIRVSKSSTAAARRIAVSYSMASQRLTRCRATSTATGAMTPESTLARRPGRGAGSLRAVATEDKNSISAVPAISRPLLDGGAIAARALPCFGLRRWKSCAEAQRLSALARRTMIPLARTTTETESKIMESVGRRTGPGTSAKARTSASW